MTPLVVNNLVFAFADDVKDGSQAESKLYFLSFNESSAFPNFILSTHATKNEVSVIDATVALRDRAEKRIVFRP